MGLKITFIGSGNVAWNLAHAFDKAGHTVIQVISRHEEHAKELASKFGAFFGVKLSELYNDSDLILVTVNDDAYQEVLENLQVNSSAILCHTSGPLGMEILEQSAQKYGVFYPLQSFNKSQLKRFLDVPLLIEGSDPRVEQRLLSLAEELSNQVQLVNSEQREKYHLAAVFANNFTNLMYRCAEQYLNQNKLDFKLLHPIIFETALRIRSASPRDLQTGPAKRGDKKVLDKHLEMLKDPALNEIYDRLSNWIMTIS